MQNPENHHNEAHISIPAVSGAERIWLRVGTLFDGENSRPLRNAHIVYDADSILYVGDEATPPPLRLINPGQSRPDLELLAFTLLPGLIEAHAHLFLEGGEIHPEKRAAYIQQPRAAILDASRRRLQHLVHFGIVGVRDAGDKLGIGLSFNNLSSGNRAPLMPYVDSPGSAINHRGEYGSFMAEPLEDFGSPRECVLSRISNGAERIKLIISDVIDFRTGLVAREPQMSSREVAEFVGAARELKKQTFAHATGQRGIESAIEGGIDSAEHGFFIRGDQLERMRDRQTAWVPTFSPVQKQLDFAIGAGGGEKTATIVRKILDQHSASLLKAHALGVPIVAGSDAGAIGVRHGFGLIEELRSMENAGLSAVQVPPERDREQLSSSPVQGEFWTN